VNDYYQGLAKNACEVTQSIPNETLEENLKYQRLFVAKRLAAIDEALTLLNAHPEVRDVLEAVKKAQNY